MTILFFDKIHRKFFSYSKRGILAYERPSFASLFTVFCMMKSHILQIHLMYCDIHVLR